MFTAGVNDPDTVSDPGILTDVRPLKLVSPVVLLTWILRALFPIVKILSYIEYIPTKPEVAYNPCVVCMDPVSATDPVSGMSSEAWPVRFAVTVANVGELVVVRS